MKVPDLQFKVKISQSFDVMTENAQQHRDQHRKIIQSTQFKSKTNCFTELFKPEIALKSIYLCF